MIIFNITFIVVLWFTSLRRSVVYGGLTGQVLLPDPVLGLWLNMANRLKETVSLAALVTAWRGGDHVTVHDCSVGGHMTAPSYMS